MHIQKLCDPRLQRAVETVGQLLPAQGPITAFVHHNTLHAFEGYPFTEAVEMAAARFGTRPYLAEADFRGLLAAGRIQFRDLDAVLGRFLGDAAQDLLAPGLFRRDLWRLVLRKDLFPPKDVRLSWFMAEQGFLHRLRPDLEADARLRLLETTLDAEDHEGGQAEVEAGLLGRLWHLCCTITALPQATAELASPPLSSGGSDRLSSWGGEQLRIFSAAYLDQGLSDWRLPHQRQGLFHAFVDLHARGALADPRWRRLRRACQDCLTQEANAETYLLSHLNADPEADWGEELAALAAPLRGFAGMVLQFEEDPERAPVEAPPCRLVDFLAVAHLLAAVDPAPVASPASEPDPEQAQAARALPLFLLMQHLGFADTWLERRSAEERQLLVRELARADDITRRRLFQEAYERRYRKLALNALSQHPRRESAPPPRWDVVVCLDEREESLRRHLEEGDPALRTFGTAGHFGLALRYRGVGDAHWSQLAPPGVAPRQLVEERPRAHAAEMDRRHARSRRTLGKVRAATDRSSHGLFLGALVHVLFGLWSTIPLVLEVLAPRLFHRLSRRGSRAWQPAQATELRLWAEQPEQPRPFHPGDPARGLTIAEAATLVRGLLEGMGLTSPSRLVLLLGHGSASLNNPQEAAHDCGACGGGRGGPNARAMAVLANDPRVRAALAADGFALPPETVFLGGWHQTCDDAIHLFDVEDLPASHAEDLRTLRLILERARRADAQERARKFLSAPISLTPERALAHVEARAHDLAQPRPEYGHATNAMLVVGRRERTLGLFLDRRAFLASYDPEQDEDGHLLAAVLGTALPVCAGINLEYYFSFVDPTGYGCGTKLPHNICGLIGVVDGAGSDLRTGLPWQMTEIHEPMRLLVVVESETTRLRALLSAQPRLQRLVDGNWVQLAALDPHGDAIQVYEDGHFRPHLYEEEVLPRARSSWEVFHGRRGSLRPAFIGPPEASPLAQEAAR